jgi:hypothetical protein
VVVWFVLACAMPCWAQNDDRDGDGLPDSWEEFFGLDAASAAGANGATGDPDLDGVNNLAEFQAATHPRGFYKRYLPEGATGPFFRTRIALTVPRASASIRAAVLLAFSKRDGTSVTHRLHVRGRGRATVNVEQLPGMADAEFSTTVESDHKVIADRTMRWDERNFGAHVETSLWAPSHRWFLAEGATHSGFELFYLLQNPGPEVAEIDVRHLRPSGPPLEKTYTLAPRSRFNIWVNLEEFPDGSGNRPLASTEVSAVLASPRQFLVERAMYRSAPGRPFDAGHASAGITQPSTTWFLAEGATGPWFDTFILIANPEDRPANLRVTYLLPGGLTYARTVSLAPTSRHSIWVDFETFDGVPGYPLADTAVSARIESLDETPVIVERAMWWPGSAAEWYEAHNAAGSPVTSGEWVLAEGETGGGSAALES